MSDATEFVQLSLTPLLIGMLAAMACALPGNILLLRRQALIGDAISHVALPGIVAAFLVTGTVSAGAMMTGAGLAAIVAVLLIELVRRLGRIEPGAAMGVIFTAMFAAGVLMIERSGAGRVHLDVEHALFGNLESLVWLSAEGWSSLLDPVALADLPPQLPRLAVVLLLVAVFLVLAWRPLVIATFDEVYARAIGLPARLLGTGLVLVTALAAVAAFDAVGSIIVIAMFVCPPAAARLMTNRLGVQVAWSLAFAALSALLGFILAGHVPLWLGARDAVSAAGMIATVSGLILAAAACFGPCRARLGAPAD
jgi:manganese/zinc/iron transport system permease protein